MCFIAFGICNTESFCESSDCAVCGPLTRFGANGKRLHGADSGTCHAIRNHPFIAYNSTEFTSRRQTARNFIIVFEWNECRGVFAVESARVEKFLSLHFAGSLFSSLFIVRSFFSPPRSHSRNATFVVLCERAPDFFFARFVLLSEGIKI